MCAPARDHGVLGGLFVGRLRLAHGAVEASFAADSYSLAVNRCGTEVTPASLRGMQQRPRSSVVIDNRRAIARIGAEPGRQIGARRIPTLLLTTSGALSSRRSSAAGRLTIMLKDFDAIHPHCPQSRPDGEGRRHCRPSIADFVEFAKRAPAKSYASRAAPSADRRISPPKLLKAGGGLRYG